MYQYEIKITVADPMDTRTLSTTVQAQAASVEVSGFAIGEEIIREAEAAALSALEHIRTSDD